MLISYISGGTGTWTYSLKSIPSDKFFEKLFLAILFILSELLLEIYWEEVAEEVFFYIFVLRSDLGYEPGLRQLPM